MYIWNLLKIENEKLKLRLLLLMGRHRVAKLGEMLRRVKVTISLHILSRTVASSVARKGIFYIIYASSLFILKVILSFNGMDNIHTKV